MMSKKRESRGSHHRWEFWSRMKDLSGIDGMVSILCGWHAGLAGITSSRLIVCRLLVDWLLTKSTWKLPYFLAPAMSSVDRRSYRLALARVSIRRPTIDLGRFLTVIRHRLCHLPNFVTNWLLSLPFSHVPNLLGQTAETVGRKDNYVSLRMVFQICARTLYSFYFCFVYFTSQTINLHHFLFVSFTFGEEVFPLNFFFLSLILDVFFLLRFPPLIILPLLIYTNT